MALPAACGNTAATPKDNFGSLDAASDSAPDHAGKLTGGDGGPSGSGLPCSTAADCADRGGCTVTACVSVGGQELSQGYCVYTPIDGGACADAGGGLPDATLLGATDAAVEAAASLDASRQNKDAALMPGSYTLLIHGWVPVPDTPGEAMAAHDAWAFDGTAWTQLSVGAPQLGGTGSMAPLNGQAVELFTNSLSDGGWEDSTSTWNGLSWTQVASMGPNADDDLAMAPVGGNLVGVMRPVAGPSSTWTWNGSLWTQLSVTTPATYDSPLGTPSVGGTLVLLDQGTTWTFDGTVWTHLIITGPPPRYDYSVAPLGGHLLVFGGADTTMAACRSDTWSFDGAAWTEIATTGPSGRCGASMAPLNGKMVLFGGATTEAGSALGDTWVFDGSTWTELPIPGPSARWGAQMATP